MNKSVRGAIALVGLVAAAAQGGACGRKSPGKATAVAGDDAAPAAVSAVPTGGGSDDAASPTDAAGGAAVVPDVPLPPVPAASERALVPAPKDFVAGVEFATFVTGLDRPVAAAHAPGDPADRLFVVEQGGRLRLVDGTRVLPEPVLDLSAVVSSGNEQGLLGLAFHPRYADNGRLYVNYTDRRGTTHVDEFVIADRAVPRLARETARPIIEIKQPYANHNGGHLAFGPDGKLYVGTGDGGAGGDPKGNGQNPKALLGKMLRFDVESDAPSAEILYLGLRNPWRYAFDAKSGDLFIADVGQNKWEFIHWVAATDHGAKNFGWNVVEGSHCFSSPSCERSPYPEPIVEYDHGQGCSITGGVVYRGSQIPALAGAFVYSDFCSGFFRSVRVTNGVVHDHWDWAAALPRGKSLGNVASFAVDGHGELVVIRLSGSLARLVPRR